MEYKFKALKGNQTFEDVLNEFATCSALGCGACMASPHNQLIDLFNEACTRIEELEQIRDMMADDLQRLVVEKYNRKAPNAILIVL